MFACVVIHVCGNLNKLQVKILIAGSYSNFPLLQK